MEVTYLPSFSGNDKIGHILQVFRRVYNDFFASFYWVAKHTVHVIQPRDLKNHKLLPVPFIKNI